MQANRSKSAQQLEALVWQFVDQGKIKQALAACTDLNRQFPRFAPGWRSASQLAQKLNNQRMALRAINKAVELEPENNEWSLQNCYCLMQLGRTGEAHPLALQLADKRLANAWQYATLGLILSRLELHEQSLEKYQAAIELEPGDGQHYYNLATLQRFMGDFDAAEDSLSHAIELKPDDYEAHKLRADMRRQTPEHNHVAELEAVLEAGIENTRGQVNILYALAKEQEDLGHHGESFARLEQGAQLRRKHMRYGVEGDLETMSRIAAVYGPEMFRGQPSGDENDEAIFVLGMPRTGTTLVERILASHSSVTAAGELNNFALQLAQLARRQPGVTGDQLEKTALVEISASLDFSQLGKAYIDSSRPLSGRTPRFIDKMPLNFLYAGLIHRALPRAKIIHLQRHPLDTCYAIYKTLFKDAYPFSYSQQELGRYYLAYRGLMAHWESVMPGVIHTVSYEALVDDVERESRRLLEYCDLPWEDGCLRFYENRAASTTASASQVREPVYQSSVGKWHCYREQLQPLRQILEQAGVDLHE